MFKLNSHKKNEKILKFMDKTNSRKEKLNQLRKQGIAFPNDFRRNITSNQIFSFYSDKNSEDLKKLNIEVKIAGRIMNRRVMGKASFITIQDMSGKIQLYISSNNLSLDKYNNFLKKIDLGDIIGACGFIFKTKTNELSINCHKVYIITKAIRSFPNKFNGLIDQETRYRQRYLDLITNDKTRELFILRSNIIMSIRNFMISNNFIEVETPMMQNIPGGAIAKPFVTHYNVLNMDMYLRISPELYLKQLIVGGFERIFEINRNFRNEGLSPYHHFEFTMMELYIAYADYHDLIFLIENLIHYLLNNILQTKIIYFEDKIINFNKPFTKMNMKEAIYKFNPTIPSNALEDILLTKNIAISVGVEIKDNWELGKLYNEIFEKTVKNYLIQPTFITCYPTEISPLARKNDDNSFFSDRFEFFICGYEIGNGFSELNDAEDQSKRFIEQLKIQNKDNKDIFYNSDYITALEYGLPPTAGLGIGIDRLIMVLTNSKNIRDVILFPTMKPRA